MIMMMVVVVVVVVMMNILKSRHSLSNASRKISGVLRIIAVRKRILTEGQPDTSDLTK
jgi:uncharacterized membrane protein